MKARHTYDSYSTHQPVLYEALLRTSGPVIEFGCGLGSTPLLHTFCARQCRELVSLESDEEWLGRFAEYVAPWHMFVHVDNWDNVLMSDEIVTSHYSLALVDQSPWEARHTTILALRDVVKFIVLHDCDYFPEHRMFGESLRALNGPDDRGLRTYDDIFEHYKEFFPLEPWPYPRTGPPTLLGSNFEDCDWDVDFVKYELVEALK